ncbi:DUF1800 family protein [Propionicimonas sp.]|uniref:DUF1800 family protein n=1 Tax=Propionicimonas sp. TaxID=1955623 RepID=UPI0039E32FD8
MTTAPPPPVPAGPPVPAPSRRAALGLAAAGGLALSSLGTATEALGAGPARPLSPVLPATISELASGLDLTSSTAWHLARRVSPAPTASLAAQIARTGTKAWIDKQLAWQKISDTKADGIVKKYLSYATMTGHEAYVASKKQAWKAGKAMSVTRTIRQVFTRRHLYESMVDTMADQLYISADGKASEFVAWFDWAVLRKYALGSYSKMLYAAVRHPALLLYLDNQVNSADSPNENLGRELLELHTVGVGHYDEEDVRQSALMLTGHGIDWTKRSYRYHPADHHVGKISVMGFTHPNATAADGPAALKAYLSYLAHHEGTARRIAERLAVRYVSDTPSDGLLSHLAAVYLANDTSLAAVMRALLRSDEFADSVGAKWRRPQETMATMVKLRRPSTIHTTTTQSKNVWGITGTVQWLLYLENHQPRMWPVVDGYPDQASAWMATQALLGHWYSANARINWGSDSEWPSKYSTWAKALGVKKGQVITDVAKRLTTDLTGYRWTQAHLDIVAGRLKGTGTGTTLSSDQVRNNLGPALHFIFASPYFMLR